MQYSADIHFPGCLPEGDGTPNLFSSASDAWQDIINGIGDDAWFPDDENDPEGPHSMRPEVLKMEAMRDAERCGTVEFNGGIYEVDWVADFEVA